MVWNKPHAPDARLPYWHGRQTYGKAGRGTVLLCEMRPWYRGFLHRDGEPVSTPAAEFAAGRPSWWKRLVRIQAARHEH